MEPQFTVSERNAPFYIQKPRKSAVPMKMRAKIRKKPLTMAEKVPLRAAVVVETADRVADESGRAVHRRTVPLKFADRWNKYLDSKCTVLYMDGNKDEFKVKPNKLSALLEKFHQCYEVKSVSISNIK